MTLCRGSMIMQYINVRHVETYLASNQEYASSGLITAIENNTDLIPSVYEGDRISLQGIDSNKLVKYLYLCDNFASLIIYTVMVFVCKVV